MPSTEGPLLATLKLMREAAQENPGERVTLPRVPLIGLLDLMIAQAKARCGTCRHWRQHAPENGDCKAPGLQREEFFVHDYETADSRPFSDSLVMVVSIDHGCVLHSDLAEAGA